MKEKQHKYSRDYLFGEARNRQLIPQVCEQIKRKTKVDIVFTPATAESTQRTLLSFPELVIRNQDIGCRSKDDGNGMTMKAQAIGYSKTILVEPRHRSYNPGSKLTKTAGSTYSKLVGTKEQKYNESLQKAVVYWRWLLLTKTIQHTNTLFELKAISFCPVRFFLETGAYLFRPENDRIIYQIGPSFPMISIDRVFDNRCFLKKDNNPFYKFMNFLMGKENGTTGLLQRA